MGGDANMLVKRNKKSSKVLFVIVFAIIFYYMLRVTTLVSANNGNWSFDYFTIALNELYKINTPIDFSRNNFLVSSGVSFAKQKEYTRKHLWLC